MLCTEIPWVRTFPFQVEIAPLAWHDCLILVKTEYMIYCQSAPTQSLSILREKLGNAVMMSLQ